MNTGAPPNGSQENRSTASSRDSKASPIKPGNRSGLAAAIQEITEDLKTGAVAVKNDIARWHRINQKAKPTPKDTGDSKTTQQKLSHYWQRAYMGTRYAGLAFALFSIGTISALAVTFLYFAPRDQIGADLWGVNRSSIAITVLDRHGDEIESRGARYGEAVNVDGLPPYLIDAFLATEDRRFYSHSGIDLKGMTRAMVANIKSGAVVEGGSTITQQLAKNLFLSPEQTYTRKIREALLALWLEGHFTKDEILSLYLNRIYLGAGAYGIDSAARTYFDKPVAELTLAEAAMLAGLPKAPSTLAPTQNPFGAANRANEVLDNLLETNAITPFQARDARKNPPTIQQGADDINFGYIYDYLAAKARTIIGAEYDEDIIIESTIDLRMQRAAQAAVRAAITTDSKIAGAEQAALVAYDREGSLRAMVGGVSYVQSQFNRATQAQRQPGSAFKPFVYITALEAGIKKNARYIDQPINIDGWEPANYNNRHLGPIRLPEAMAKSINSIAIQLSEQVGRAKVVETAKRMGIDADLPAVPSIALGAANMTLEDLTSAYLPLARGGLDAEPYAITRIRNARGDVLYTHQNYVPRRVISKTISKDMNHLLYQVMNGGTGGNAHLGKRPAVGKTGTTNDWRDAWFLGYTAQLTTGVWVGNDAYRGMDNITGGKLPAVIWKEFMLAAHQGMSYEKIGGATPAIRHQDESALISFYEDMSRGLRRVRRDGRIR